VRDRRIAEDEGAGPSTSASDISSYFRFNTGGAVEVGAGIVVR
jgi:hypothetical protein